MNNDATEAALALLRLCPTNLHNPPSLIPQKRKQSDSDSTNNNSNSEAISCICGLTDDDGFSIACDDCSRWCHAACFDIVQGKVPEEWRCWVCDPATASKHRPRKSPGLERKHRKTSASSSAIDGGKRRRRTSVNVPAPTPAPPWTTTTGEDEHVDIDEPWNHSYVHIEQDIIPNIDTREKLRRQAQRWRGVTALTTDDPPPTVVRPVSPVHPSMSVRPPTYAVHTTLPIQSNNFITPYTSTITPSSTYLADPLNAYAHLGMPKPFVHLFGPPLDLTLDSRITGDKSRFVRSGCRPNAVLRPVLCAPRAETLSFGVFALRDLRADEEIVLGWEWDDGNAVHALPALIQSPHMFPSHSHSNNARSPDHINHLRNQMSNILHALGSTFTTCACGNKARDCVLTQMEVFVDGEGLEHHRHTSRDGDRDGETYSGGGDGHSRESTGSSTGMGSGVDLGPLIGVQRGFKTREKVPFSGGMSGVEMYPSSSGGDEENFNTNSRNIDAHTNGIIEPEHKMPPKMRKAWIHRSSEVLKDQIQSQMQMHASPNGSIASLSSSTTTTTEHSPMPPPPMPASIDPTTISSWPLRHSHSQIQLQSPSTSFAKLSLLSPIFSSTSNLNGNGNGNGVSASWSPQPTDSQDHIRPESEPDAQDVVLNGHGTTEEPEPEQEPAHQEQHQLFDSSVSATPSGAPSHSDPIVDMTIPPNDMEPPPSPPPAIPVPSQPQPSPEPSLPALASAPTPTEASQPLTAPPPPPKVKLSLKDFALRKKKQREEVAKMTPSAAASGVGAGAGTTESAARAMSTATVMVNGSGGQEREQTAESQDVVMADADAVVGGRGLSTHGNENVNEEGSNDTKSKWTHSSAEVKTSPPPPPSTTRDSPVPILAPSLMRSRSRSRSSSPHPTLSTEPKTESIDVSISNGSINHVTGANANSGPLNHAQARNTPESAPEPPPPPLPLSSDKLNKRSHSQSPLLPLPAPTHEDGEIPSTTTSPNPNLKANQKQKQKHSVSVFVPRSHTPPTQPRSFHAISVSPRLSISPSTSSHLHSRRTSPPSSSSTSHRLPVSVSAPPSLPLPLRGPSNNTSNHHINNTPGPSTARPLPSGPRALRAPLPPAPPQLPYRPFAAIGSQFIPRGPSADRDRDREREREREWGDRDRDRERERERERERGLSWTALPGPRRGGSSSSGWGR